MLLFEHNSAGLIAGTVFTVMLVAAAVEDIRTRRIPNLLVLILAVSGLAFSGSGIPGSVGLVNSAEGLGIGLACWLPFYALGWLGAGDVKLYAAAGAWLGPTRALEGAAIAALAGAVLSVVWMIKSHGSRNALQILGMAAGSPKILSASTQKNRLVLPYGVAIAFGAICVAWLPWRWLG